MFVNSYVYFTNKDIYLFIYLINCHVLKIRQVEKQTDVTSMNN